MESRITHIKGNNNSSSIISGQLNGSTEKSMMVEVLRNKSRPCTQTKPPKRKNKQKLGQKPIKKRHLKTSKQIHFI